MSDTSQLSSRAALVTGGAGFIGSHLVDALLSLGARVRVLDDLSNGKLENLDAVSSRIEFVEGDIRDADICRDACRGIDVVFHQAALGSVPRSMKDPATSMAVNVGGTTNMLAAARDAGVRRFVYASSSSVYGDSARLPKREGEEGRPLSPYALSKVVDEQLAEVFGRCYGLEIVGLRYFNVYGPRQDPEGPYAAVIPRFFKAYLEGSAPVIYGDGEQSRDFTFVTDAVEANILAGVAGASATGKAYNVAGGNRTTVNVLAEAVRNAVGGGPKPIYEAPRPGDVAHSAADLSAVQRELRFAPRVGLAEGLKLSLSHYRRSVGAGAP